MDWKNCTFKYVEYNGEDVSIQVSQPKVGDVTPSMSVPIAESNTDYALIKQLLDDGEITISASDKGEEWSRRRTVREEESLFLLLNFHQTHSNLRSLN